MRNQLTNISCLTGLILIFLMAAIFRDGYFWVAGLVSLILILGIRNLLGEVTLKTEWFFAGLGWFFTIITLFIMNNRM